MEEHPPELPPDAEDSDTPVCAGGRDMESRVAVRPIVVGTTLGLGALGALHLLHGWIGVSLTYLAVVPLWLAVHMGGRISGGVLGIAASVWLTIVSGGSGWEFLLHLGLLTGLMLLIDGAAVSLQKANRSATRDALTGLPNRRGVAIGAVELFQQAQQSGRPITVVVIDCDDFKQINDRFGHASGDTALRSVADALRACRRPNDIVCRTSGDEFLAVLWDADAMAAHQFLGRVRANLSLRKNPKFGVVSISSGIASLGRDGTTLADLTSRADDRMYRHKNLARVYDSAVVDIRSSSVSH